MDWALRDVQLQGAQPCMCSCLACVLQQMHSRRKSLQAARNNLTVGRWHPVWLLGMAVLMAVVESLLNSPPELGDFHIVMQVESIRTVDGRPFIPLASVSLQLDLWPVKCFIMDLPSSYSKLTYPPNTVQSCNSVSLLSSTV